MSYYQWEGLRVNQSLDNILLAIDRRHDRGHSSTVSFFRFVDRNTENETNGCI